MFKIRFLATSVFVIALLLVALSARGEFFKTLDALAQSRIDAQNPMYKSTVGLFLGGTSGYAAFSGTQIAPQWIYTAQHPFFGVGTVGYVSVSTGNMYNYDQAVDADAWYFYPGWSNGMPIGTGVDLALVHLSKPLTGVSSTPVFRGEDQRGTPMYMAGYGEPGTYSTGRQPFDGDLRAGDSIGEYFGGDPAWAWVGSQYWALPFNRYSRGNWQTTPGDSGLAYLAYLPAPGDTEPVLQVVGINRGCLGNYGDGASFGIRTSLYTDWSDQVMGVPEPSSLAMSAVLLPFVAVLIYRIRRPAVRL